MGDMPNVAYLSLCPHNAQDQAVCSMSQAVSLQRTQLGKKSLILQKLRYAPFC